MAQLNEGEGPLFRKINRWGHLSDSGLAPGSIIPMLRQLLLQAGVANTEAFSSHSLRRGFANWARLSGWDIRELMSYVGWRDVKAAMRYLDGAGEDLKGRFEHGLDQVLPLSSEAAPKTTPQLPAIPEIPVSIIEVSIQLSPFNNKNNSGKTRALRNITQRCLARFQAQQIDSNGHLYRISVPTPTLNVLDDSLYILLDELHQVADARQCFLEAFCRDPVSGKQWD